MLLLIASFAHSHATFVFGSLTLNPDPPQAGSEARLRIKLEDPSLAPVEDAVVFVELRRLNDPAAPLPAPSTAAPDLPEPLLELRLVEVEAGLYETHFTLPNPGSYHVLVRDYTFPWEETNASVVMLLSAPAGVNEGANGALPFILPPTAIAPQSLWTWIAWLVGLPLAVGLVVTIVILRQGASRNPEGA